MLDRAKWINRIKTRLGHPILKIAMTDDMISEQCDEAIRKVAPYLNSVDVFEVSSKKTVFTDKLVYAVIRVHSTKATYTTNSEAVSDIYQMKAQYGGLLSSDASYTQTLETSMMYQTLYDTVTETIDDIGFRLAGNTLFIDGQNPPYTVEAITDKSVENMPENYRNWCFDYSLALTKIVEGTILSKVKIQGSPIDTRGDSMISEGNSMINELENKLGGVSHSLFYCMR